MYTRIHTHINICTRIHVQTYSLSDTHTRNEVSSQANKKGQAKKGARKGQAKKGAKRYHTLYYPAAEAGAWKRI